MKKLLATSLIATPIIIALSVANAATVDLPGLAKGANLGTSETDIAAVLENFGATIDEMETEDDEIEVEFTLDGVTYELEVDAATGLVAEVELEEEDDTNDDENDDDDSDED